MQLGFVSALFGELTLEEVLQVAAEESYDCVEVMCWPASGTFAGVCHLNLENFTSTEAERVHELCARYRVNISALGYYPNPLSSNPDEAKVAREHIYKLIDAASLLGIGKANTFIGADHRLPLEANLQTFREVWPAIIRHAEGCNVQLAIENCPMLYADYNWPSGTNLARSPEAWRQMFEAIPSANFGLNIDPSHLVWQMIDYIEPIYEFRHRIFHAHAKDMRVEKSQLNRHGILGMGWHTAKLPGLGDVDWGRWISALTDIGYNGPVCVEVEDRAFYGDLARRKQSLRLARNVLRPLIV